MNIQLSKDALKVFNKVDRPTQQRFKQALLALPKGDVKAMVGLRGLYRLRIGDWRILFSYVSDTTVFVEKIAPRGEIYKGV